jgi:chromosome segregation ATPase
MNREHARIVSEQARELQEMVSSDKDIRRQTEEIVRGKAEADAALGTLKDRVSALKDEVERLRRQVHELQQESADKEVEIVQLTKQRSQDKEDMQGLNIALDSKQQELELVSACWLGSIVLWILTGIILRLA